MKSKYNKKNLEQIVKENLSIAGVCRSIGIVPIGGNYKTVNYYINLYNLDTKHFTGQGWNVGTRYRKIKKSAPLSEILIENSNYINTNNLKKRLLKENILEYKCNICNITEWINKPLTLHLDHKNGNNMDNRIENLRLLCPNCHSQTETYCNKTKNSKCNDYRKKMYIKYKDSTIEKILQKKQKTKKENFCICGKKIKESSNYCKKCYNLKQRKVERPTYEQLLKDIKELNYTNTGKKYDVSDNTIRKWLKSYNG